MTDKLLIGSVEVCKLPAFGIEDLQMRVDTGAKTSSLHVDNLVHTKHDGVPYVEFDLHPDVYNFDQTVRCVAPLFDTRRIKSSNGEVERRSVIKTQLELAHHLWDIEITLSNREGMSYPMLLGREAMIGRVIVDPGESFLASNEPDEL
uniref:ATP-dependent zinc protease family protein n=1 Tax=Thaumasiovibrio occultus TaxID=1891184 RepID=UPI000B350E52|nr:RimK/LysX family protein [Thaumasiovibrio occultus]